jgi:hypothetical protein
MTPTEKILAQIREVHKYDCNSKRLARQLEEAVKALEKTAAYGAVIEPGTRNDSENVIILDAREALSLIEQLGASEEGE